MYEPLTVRSQDAILGQYFCAVIFTAPSYSNGAVSPSYDVCEIFSSCTGTTQNKEEGAQNRLGTVLLNAQGEYNCTVVLRLINGVSAKTFLLEVLR